MAPFLMQNLIQMLRLVIPHAYQEDAKRFIIHTMRLSGESRLAPNRVQKWLQRASRGWLALTFFVVRGGSWRSLHSGRDLCGLNFLPAPRERTLNLSLTFSQVWRKHGGGRAGAWKLLAGKLKMLPDLNYISLAFYLGDSHILGIDIFLWDIVKIT